MANVIEVRDSPSASARSTAVNDVSFSVERGEIFGLLGKNGAGKTTTVEILEGYQSPDEGRVAVLGVEPKRAAARGRTASASSCRTRTSTRATPSPRPSNSSPDSSRTPRAWPRPWSSSDSPTRRTSRIGRLSGGQRRRVDVALGIVGSPELLFLDEPTTGFDPSARREFWTMLEGLRSAGTSILLTTHYMEEAQHLCDRIAILAAGRIVAEGTSTSLIALAGDDDACDSTRSPDSTSRRCHATPASSFVSMGDVVSATIDRRAAATCCDCSSTSSATASNSTGSTSCARRSTTSSST